MKINTLSYYYQNPLLPEEDKRKKQDFNNVLHYRDFRKEKEDRQSVLGVKPQYRWLAYEPFEIASIAMFGHPMAKQKLFGLKPEEKLLGIDSIYKGIRGLENKLPIFRIAVKASQAGDLLSPFVSEKQVSWKMPGSQLIHEEQGKYTWRQEVSGIKENILTKTKKIIGPDGKSIDVGPHNAEWLDKLVQEHGLEFEKKGRVFGDIVSKTKEGKKFTLLENAFLMERGKSESSAVASLWEANTRSKSIFSALDEDHWLVRGAKYLFGDTVTAKREMSLRKFGGFTKNYLGEYLFEHVRAMNKFLKEPIPIISKLFSLPGKDQSVFGTNAIKQFQDPVMKGLEQLLGAEEIKAGTEVAFGRLRPWMRPYVVSEYWRQSAPRMLAALAAKGSIYTMGLPAAYTALNAARRSFDFTGSSIISTPLFAAAGLGLGSLIESKTLSQVGKLAYFGRLGMTKTQFAGAAIGAAVGAMPTFDKGFAAGAGALYSRARIASSKMWNIIGAQDAVERQEGLLPGITSPWTAAGFMMSGGVLGYIHREIGTMKGMATSIGYNSKFYESIESQYKNIIKDVRDISSFMDIPAGDLPTPALQKIRSTQTAINDLFQKYQQQETPGLLSSTKEATRILSGEQAVSLVPKSEGAFLASLIKTHADVTNFQIEKPSDLASQLFHKGEEYASALKAEQRTVLLELPFTKRIYEQAKERLLSPKASFARGAIKGGLAFGGVSMLGALAAGPMGGDFSIGDLIPGWIVNLTGGGMKPKETEDIFTGKKEVAIRKARGWSMGQSPVEGGKVSYFRQHRAVEMQTDAKDNALYGSYGEKIAYDPILHPISFLLSDEFKYHRDLRLSEVSPTPLTGRLFTEVPILGDLLASTIGEVIKPTHAIRPNEWRQLGITDNTFQAYQAEPISLASLTSPQVQTPPGFFDFGKDIAPPVPVLGGKTEFQAQTTQQIAYTTSRTLERLAEQAGLRGFMLQSMTENFFGKIVNATPVVESGENLTSIRSSFWSMNLGDPFGASEAARRYLTRNKDVYYNPLSNQSPSWLPSSSSYLDFRHGSYFNKVQEGYLRLPGAGLEELHKELKDFHPEDYPLVWKHKVLSDVSYMSDEWKIINQQVQQSLEAGALSQREKQILAQTNEQIEEKRLKRVFREYQFDKEKTKKMSLTVSAVYDDGTISVAEFGKREVKLGGLNLNFSALSRKAMEDENLSTIQAAEIKGKERQEQIISYLKKTLRPGTRIEAEVANSEVDIYSGSSTSVYLPKLNSTLQSMGAATDKYDDVVSSVKHNAAQKIVGRAWELFTHNADLPLTPALALNKILPFQPQSKFIQRLTPTELYARTQVYGKEIQLWQNYKEDFIDSAANETQAKLFGDFIPKKTAYRRAINEYFDKLTWIKYFMLEQAAHEGGRADAVEFYSQKRKETIFGSNPYTGFSDTWKALPRSERDFFRDFTGEEDPEERKKILALVPEDMKNIFIAQWQNKEIQALAHKIEAGVASKTERSELMSLYNIRRVEGMNWSQNLQNEYEAETRGRDVSYADWMRFKQLGDYFSNFKMPDKSFVGFNPMTDLEDIKLQVVKNEGCLTPNSEVIINTSMDTKNIKDLKIGDFVLGQYMNLEQVINIKESFYNGEIYKLSFGPFSTFFTPNHIVPVLKTDNQVFQIKEIPIEKFNKSLKDKSLFPKIKFNESIEEIDLVNFIKPYKYDDKFIYTKGSHNLPNNRFLKCTYELGLFLGWWLAEGSTSRNNRIQFALNSKDEKHIADWLIAFANEYFGTKGSIHKVKDANCLVVTIYGKFIHDLCISLFGKGALQKNINTKIYNMPKDFIMGILFGWFLGDGNIAKKESIFNTSSEKLAYQGWFLLNSLGFSPRIRSVRGGQFFNTKTQKYINTANSYRIAIGKKNLRENLHNSIIPPKDLREYIPLEIRESYFWIRPKIEKVFYSGEVYDIEVTDPKNFFLTYTGLVHNSNLHDFGKWESQESSLQYKPYVVSGANEIKEWQDASMTPGEFEAHIRRMIPALSPMVRVTPLPYGQPTRILMAGKDTQTAQIQKILNGYGDI